MVAARLFNQQENEQISTIYRAVTIGTIWQFIQLESHIISIDLREYYIRDIEKILGILMKAVS